MALFGFRYLICFTLNITSWCPFQWLIQLGVCAVGHYFWCACSCMSWGTSTEKLPLWEEAENQWTHTHTHKDRNFNGYWISYATFKYIFIKTSAGAVKFSCKFRMHFLSDYKAYRFENVEKCKIIEWSKKKMANLLFGQNEWGCWIPPHLSQSFS